MKLFNQSTIQRRHIVYLPYFIRGWIHKAICLWELFIISPWLCFCFHRVSWLAGAHSTRLLLCTNSVNPSPICRELYISGPHCNCEASTIFVGSGPHFHPHFNTADTHQSLIWGPMLYVCVLIQHKFHDVTAILLWGKRGIWQDGPLQST